MAANRTLSQTPYNIKRRAQRAWLKAFFETVKIDSDVPMPGAILNRI